MDITTTMHWNDLLSVVNREALIELLQDQARTFALLDRVSKKDFSQYLRDERDVLRLLALIARNAHWITGELHILIEPCDTLGLCAISMMDIVGSNERCLKQVEIPSSFREFWASVDTTSILLTPLCVHTNTTKRKITLAAPRPNQRPQIAPPLPPHERAALGRIDTAKRSVVQPPPPQRPETERPPALELELDDDEPTSPGGYSMVQPRKPKANRTSPVAPQAAPSEKKPAGYEDEIDAGWGD